MSARRRSESDNYKTAPYLEQQEGPVADNPPRHGDGWSGAHVEPFGQESTFAMYKMEINVSGQQRAFLFRGPGCRKTMLEWWRDHLDRAGAGEDIRSIRVWGTVGNKTDIVRKWAKFPTLSASLSMPPAGGAHERRRGLPDGQIAAAAHRVADGGMDHGK